jgi:hypothetical protein
VTLAQSHFSAAAEGFSGTWLGSCLHPQGEWGGEDRLVSEGAVQSSSPGTAAGSRNLRLDCGVPRLQSCLLSAAPAPTAINVEDDHSERERESERERGRDGGRNRKGERSLYPPGVSAGIKLDEMVRVGPTSPELQGRRGVGAKRAERVMTIERMPRLSAYLLGYKPSLHPIDIWGCRRLRISLGRTTNRHGVVRVGTLGPGQIDPRIGTSSDVALEERILRQV